MVTRREVLLGTGGVAVIGGAAVLNHSFGWPGLWGSNPYQPVAKEMVRKGGGYQTFEGDILGDLYLTCQFAVAAVSAGFTPETVRNGSGRSINDYFATTVQINSLGSRNITDSISRLLTSRVLGLDTDFRRAETEVLFQQRITADEHGFSSLQTAEDSLAYLPFGAIALRLAGASRTNPLFGRIQSLLTKIRNGDGGYPERPGAVSVADMSSAVLIAGMAPKDNQAEGFLHSLAGSTGFAFNLADRGKGVSNITSTALVNMARLGAYNIPEYLAHRWTTTGQLDNFTEGDTQGLYNLFMAAQVLGKPVLRAA